jgi:anti-anti-sigma factor
VEQSPLRIATSRTAPTVLSLAIGGDLDVVTADELRSRLIGMLDGDRPTLIDLDLSAVGFCDLLGLAALLTFRVAATSVGCRVVISCAALGTGWLLGATEVGELFGYRAATGRPGTAAARSYPTRRS